MARHLALADRTPSSGRPAVARHTEPAAATVGATAGTTNGGPLSPDQLTVARRFYQRRADRFRPELVARLQQRLDVAPADGRVNDELIQRVAAFQQGESDGRPPLGVDGMAGPNTLILLFPDSTGSLSRARTGLFFAATAKEDVIERWDELPDGHARAMAMIHLVNRRLKEAGVPEVGNTADMTTGSSTVAGLFIPDGWYIQVADDGFADDLDLEGRRYAASTVYHEARHAEQSWLQTRALVTTTPPGAPEEQVATIAEAVGVPHHIVEVAQRAGPLADPVTALIGTEWHLTGDWSARQRATDRQFLGAIARYTQLRDRGADQGRLDQARAECARAATGYFDAHPIEFDAHRVDNLIDWALDADVSKALW